MTDEVVAVTRYLYDKDGNILAEKKNNVLGNVYIYGNGLENLLIGYNVYRYTANAHGDVVKVYSGSTVVAEYDYEAYGENIKCTENGISNPIRYAGYYSMPLEDVLQLVHVLLIFIIYVQTPSYHVFTFSPIQWQ